jgi:hypothetical protein
MNPLFSILLCLFAIGWIYKPTTTTTPTTTQPIIVEKTVIKYVDKPMVKFVPATCDYSRKDAEILSLKKELREIAVLSKQAVR